MPTQLYDDFATFSDLADWDREPEISFYSGFVRERDRALLELGCGTGRLCTPVAAAMKARHAGAVRAVGLDISPRMLEVARAREPGIEWVEGDMSAPPLRGSFDLILCAFNTLQLLPSKEAVDRTFRSTAQLLHPEGRFVFDLYNASCEETESTATGAWDRLDRVIRSFTDPAGRLLQVREDSRPDPQGRFIDLDWRVVDAARPGGPVLARLNKRLHHYRADEIEQLLHDAGLVIQARYGDIRKTPFTATASKKQVVVAMRARA